MLFPVEYVLGIGDEGSPKLPHIDSPKAQAKYPEETTGAGLPFTFGQQTLVCRQALVFSRHGWGTIVIRWVGQVLVPPVGHVPSGPARHGQLVQLHKGQVLERRELGQKAGQGCRFGRPIFLLYIGYLDLVYALLPAQLDTSLFTFLRRLSLNSAG